MKINYFSRLRNNDFIKNQMLSAACAAGIAATFGAPFGGVLFSIEVTSTYYPVSSLWKNVFCTLFGSFFFSLFRYFNLKGEIEFTKFPEESWRPLEYFSFIILGILCGLLGALFVFLFRKCVEMIHKFKSLLGSKYLLIMVATFITASISFPVDPFLKRNKNIVLK